MGREAGMREWAKRRLKPRKWHWRKQKTDHSRQVTATKWKESQGRMRKTDKRGKQIEALFRNYYYFFFTMSMRLSWMRLSVVLSLLLISPSPDDSYCSRETRTAHTHSQRDVTYHHFSTTHMPWKVLHAFDQMQLLQLEHQDHPHAKKIDHIMNSDSSLNIQMNHCNTNRFTQIMDRVCMDWKVSMLPTWWLNCDLPNQNWPRSDCKLHAQYYGKMDGKTQMLWQFIGATQTMFKNNHPYKTENKTQTRSKVNVLVLPAEWKRFYSDTGFITLRTTRSFHSVFTA